MEIPQEAIQAAANHQRLDAGECLCGWKELGRSHVEHQLEAAAPFIAAQALRHSTAIAEGMHDPVTPECREWADWLRARAGASNA